MCELGSSNFSFVYVEMKRAQHLLQLSGMTFRARGNRSSNEASRTSPWISRYDITAQLAKIKRHYCENTAPDRYRLKSS